MSFDRIEYAGLTFTDDEIVDGEAFGALSLTCDALEIGTFSVELYLTDPDAGAALAEFHRNAKLLYYHRDRLRGTYYVESVARTGKCTYEITANDALSLLDQSNHMGGIYTGQTVAEVAAEICNIPYLIQSKLAGIKLYGWLPIASRRSNLAQVLFAVGGVAKVDRNGVLRLETLWNGACSNIPEDRVFWGDKVNYASKVTEVSVLEHQYIAGAEEIKLFEGATVDGDVIQFSEPAHSLTAEGFNILEKGANYARVSGGSGTLTGRKYVHTTRDVREPVAQDEVPNVVEVTEATLVSLTNSAAVAQRLAAYYRQVESVEHEVIYDGESPGDVVTMAHPYGGATFGCVYEAAVSLGRSPTAAEKAVLGYAPPGMEQTEILEERVVLTGSGSWTPPEGVDSVRAVLIGGGQNGESGASGTVGSRPQNDSDSTQTTQTVGPDTDVTTTTNVSTFGSSSPGSGGRGGRGGSAGKVYQVELEVRGPVSYRCGSPAAYGESSPTTFGSASSDSGSVSAGGYFDPITGEVFAKAGADGRAGGNGGSAGRNGEAAGTASGGNGATKSQETAADSASTTPVSGAAAAYRLSATANWGRGAGGGGAGGDGENGGSPYFMGDDFAARLSSANTGSATVYGITGGNGGAGKNGAPAQTYGSGGDGGCGGGGTGANSASSLSVTVRGYWYKRSSGSTVETLTLNVFASAAATGGGTPVAGTGGTGGAGKEGCIILYYSVPKKIASGPVKDRTGRMVLDRLGRRIVV